MAKKKPVPVPDVPMNPEPIVVAAIVASAAEGDPVVVDAVPTADTPPTEPAPEATADTAPAQVIVVFDRPPTDVETEIRVACTERHELVATRIYRTWANGREGVGTEGGPPKLDLLEAQDAVRWLVAQPLPPGAIEEVPTAETGEGGEVVYLPRPTPVLVEAAPPPRTKILATRSIQHEYQLTDDERITLGSQLANLEADCENEEADQSAKKRAMRERLSALRGERARVADIIRRGAEVRTVGVVDVADYEDRIVRTMDEETCAVLSTRPLETHESQVPLFGALKPKAAEVTPDPVPAGDDADPFAVEEEEEPNDTDADTDTDEEEVDE